VNKDISKLTVHGTRSSPSTSPVSPGSSLDGLLCSPNITNSVPLRTFACAAPCIWNTTLQVLRSHLRGLDSILEWTGNHGRLSSAWHDQNGRDIFLKELWQPHASLCDGYLWSQDGSPVLQVPTLPGSGCYLRPDISQPEMF
jgi:hypothetical protein